MIVFAPTSAGEISNMVYVMPIYFEEQGNKPWAKEINLQYSWEDCDLDNKQLVSWKLQLENTKDI